jgi:hypothetical protein
LRWVSSTQIALIHAASGRSAIASHTRWFNIKAKREAHLAITAVLRQLMRGAGAVGAHQDLGPQRLLVKLLQREADHRGVIAGGVRAGVARVSN